MLFRLVPLRFFFLARQPIYFPPGKSSNILRGAFGIIFRRLACLPGCSEARTCERRLTCPYARIFEPTAASGEGPSGLLDHPRPFVFRALHLDGHTFAAGQRFYFDINLFDTDPIAVAYFVLAFAQLAREGLGPGRGKVELTAVSNLNQFGQPESLVYQDGVILNPPPAVTLDLGSNSEPADSHLIVTFVTPTELKSGDQLAAVPAFPILAARARDRISTLRQLYGDGGALPIDFRSFGERAALIAMTRCDVRNVAVERRSSRTGQTHSLGGFVGEAEYEGDLAEFLPYLRAAQWTGIGRQTVWGKGEISIGANS